MNQQEKDNAQSSEQNTHLDLISKQSQSELEGLEDLSSSNIMNASRLRFSTKKRSSILNFSLDQQLEQNGSSPLKRDKSQPVSPAIKKKRFLDKLLNLNQSKQNDNKSQENQKTPSTLERPQIVQQQQNNTEEQCKQTEPSSENNLCNFEKESYRKQLQLRKNSQLNINDNNEDDPEKFYNNLVKIAAMKRKRNLFILGMILLAIIIITISTIGILSLTKKDENKQEKKIIPKCKQGFFELNGGCTFYDASVFAEEDINQSLPGQENNVLTMIKKQYNLETYQYQIENSQVTSDLNGEQTEMKVSEIHNIGFLTTNITENSFLVSCILFNSTHIDSNDEQQFFEGYPGQELLPVLLDWDGISEIPVDPSIFRYHDQNGQPQQLQKPEIDGELLETLSEWQIQEQELLNVSKENYFISQIPVIFLEINKSGEIIDITFPVNLLNSFKQMLPFILEQYSPNLNQEVYSKITAEINGNRRILKESDEQKSQNNAFGEYKQDHSLHFPHSDEPSHTVGILEKNYGQSTSSNGGSTIQQNQNLNQQTQVQGGQITQTRSSAQMGITNPPAQELENNETQEGTERGENISDSQNLMGDIQIFQEADFQLVENRQISEKSSTIIRESQIGSITRSMTIENYKSHINDQIEATNTENERKYAGIDLETVISQDGEHYDHNAYVPPSDGELTEEQRRSLVAVGEYLLKPVTYRLFQFNVLGMTVKKELTFSCIEGSDKDECSLKPVIHLSKAQIPIKTLKARVEISQVVKRLNWFKRNILDKAEIIANILSEKLQEIQESSIVILNEIQEFVHPDTNPVIGPFEEVLDSFQTLIDGTYNKLVDFINEATFLTDFKFEKYIMSIISKTINLVFQLFNDIEYAWDDMGNTIDFNLQELDSLITNNYPLIPVQVCETISVASDQFADFTQIQRNFSSSFLQKIMEEILFEPMNDLLKNFSAFSQDNDGEEDSDSILDEADKELEKMKNIFINIANSLIFSVIIEPINAELEKQQGFYKVQQLIQQKIETVTTKISQKLGNVEQICYQNSTDDLELTDFELQEFSRLINISQFIQLPIFDNQENQNILSQLSEDFITSFKTEFQGHKEQIQNLYLELKNFALDLKNNFTNGVSDIKENILDLTDQVKEGVLETKDTIYDSSRDIVQSSRELITDIRRAIQAGNRNNQELEDEPLDIREIVDQVKAILKLRPVFLDLGEIYNEFKEIPEAFEDMVEYFQNLIKKPQDIIEIRKIDLDRIKFFDEFDISTLFRNIFSNSKALLEDAYESQVQTKVKQQTLSTLDTDVNDIVVSFVEETQEQLFDKTIDLDDLFQQQLEILQNAIQTERLTLFDKELYTYSFKQKYIYQTPIYIPIEIKFGIDCVAKAKVDFWLKGTSINLDTELSGSVSGNASGGISVPTVELVAYARGLLFEGAPHLELGLGFTNKLFGRILGGLRLKALQIQAGIAASFIYIKIHIACWKVDLGLFDMKVCVPIPSIHYHPLKDIIPPLKIKGVEKDLTLFEKEVYF